MKGNTNGNLALKEDNTSQSLKKANQAGQLAKDSKVISLGNYLNSNNARRSNNSLSSKSSNNNNNVNNISNISKFNNKKDSEAKKRLQNRQNQTIKMAEKIPVVSKYAKMAKMAEKIKAAKANKSNPLKNLFGSKDDKQPTPAETEEAIGAEQRGEEYKPEQAEGKFTAISSKTTKLIIVWSILGFMGANIFLCVILASAITDSAKESYLASNENATEEDLEKAYNSQSGDEGNSSSSSNVSGDGTLTFTESFTSGNTKTSFFYTSTEPDPATAINYWDSLDYNDFVYPKDSSTGKSLGAWPKNYKSIPTQLSGYKTYQNNFIWPSTPDGGQYNFVYEHNGIDIMASFGTPVYSPVDGTLVYSTWGHTVNKGSDETAYSVTIIPDKVVNFAGTNIDRIFMTHMSGIVNRCEEGSCNKKVKKGELLGFSGNAAGDAYTIGWAPHLHMTFYNEAGGYSSTGLGTSNMQKLYEISSGTTRSVGE